MTPEGRLLARFIKWLETKGLKFIRLALQPGVRRGWPDLLVLIPGGAGLFVEMKRPHPTKSAAEMRSATQALRHKELCDAGYSVASCNSYDQAVRAVLQALDARAIPA